jgi:DNA-binding transcriptional LysR family regulator
MRFHHLDLNLLVALNALIEERSVSVAADRLRLSQSAMSGALARLREALGDELLLQEGRRMVLTPRAVDLGRHVKEILQQVERDVMTRREFDPATSVRTVQVMASDYAVSTFLADAFRAVSEDAPGIRFDVRPIDGDPFGALDRDDIKLLVIPEHYASPRHATRRIFHDHYVAVAWEGNTDIGDAIDLAALMRTPHVIVEFNGSRSQSLAEWFAIEHGCRLPCSVLVSNYNVVPFLVVGTPRVSIMHSRLAEFYARSMPLRIVSLPVAVPPIIEVMQWQRVNDGDEGLMWVIDRIARSTAKLATRKDQRIFEAEEA